MTATPKLVKLVHTGADLATEIDELESPEACMLTPAAFAREAVLNAETTEEERDEIATKIAKGRTPEVEKSITQMMLHIVGRGGLHAHRRPISRRAGGYVRGERANAEMAALFATPAILYAIAVKRLVDQGHPFGTCKDGDAHEAKIAEARQRMLAVERDIEDAWTGADVELMQVEPNERDGGLCKLQFKRWGGVYVGENLGERLIRRQIAMDLQHARDKERRAAEKAERRGKIELTGEAA